jgi:beta-phosphoglucomutase-like phosphatase (HAD superfamily)
MSSRSQKVFIWDFDGVISDSLTECLTVVALAAHSYQKPEKAVTKESLIHICDVVYHKYSIVEY